MRTRLRVCHEKQSNIIHESTPQITFEPCGRVSSTHIEILILLSLVILFIARLTPKRKQEKTIFNLFFPSFFFEEKKRNSIFFCVFFFFFLRQKKFYFWVFKDGARRSAADAIEATQRRPWEAPISSAGHELIFHGSLRKSIKTWSSLSEEEGDEEIN